MAESPLERMYPNRCYDCLAGCPHDQLLCGSCQAVYAKARRQFGRERHSP